MEETCPWTSNPDPVNRYRIWLCPSMSNEQCHARYSSIHADSSTSSTFDGVHDQLPLDQQLVTAVTSVILIQDWTAILILDQNLDLVINIAWYRAAGQSLETSHQGQYCDKGYRIWLCPSAVMAKDPVQNLDRIMIQYVSIVFTERK